MTVIILLWEQYIFLSVQGDRFIVSDNNMETTMYIGTKSKIDDEVQLFRSWSSKRSFLFRYSGMKSWSTD
jgi:hypothetical protein